MIIIFFYNVNNCEDILRIKTIKWNIDNITFFHMQQNNNNQTLFK